MRDIKVLSVYHQSTHHSGYSGYAQFLKYIQNKIIIYPKPTLPYVLAKKLSKRIAKGLGNYDTYSLYKEIQVILNILKLGKTPKVIHYLNGERDIRLAVSLFKERKNTKFIATFHKPPNLLEAVIENNTYLKKLDAAIVVGNNQVTYIKQWLDIKNVYYIPHGVDTDFYQPNYSLRPHSHQNILLVGQHLRDFEMFNRVILKLLETDAQQYEIQVVLRKEYQKKVLQHPKVKIHSGVSDDELRIFYQSAHVLFIPFTDVTACNSVLEAMACGLPIVTNKSGGNLHYLMDTENIMLPTQSTSQYYKQAIQNILEKDKGLAVSKASRKKSETYHWTSIASQIAEVYQKVYEK